MGSRPAILSLVLRWLIRLAGVLVTAVLAYAWGDFATDPGPLEALVLIGFTVVLGAALLRLYRPGGMAAFEWDEEPGRRAPGEAVPPAVGREREVPGPAPAAPAREAQPRAPQPPQPPSSGSLWSRERDPGP